MAPKFGGGLVVEGRRARMAASRCPPDSAVTRSRPTSTLLQFASVRPVLVKQWSPGDPIPLATYNAYTYSEILNEDISIQIYV